MDFIYLQESALSTGVTVFFGIIGFIIMVALLVYLKAGISSVTNTRYVDRYGKTVINPNSFKDINDFVTEKAIDAKNKLMGNETKAPMKQTSPIRNVPIKKINVDFKGIIAGHGIDSRLIGQRDYTGLENMVTKNGITDFKQVVYEKEGLTFIAFPPLCGYIREISIFGDHKAVTEEGIGLGSTVQSVYDAYGPAELKGAKGTGYMFAIYDGIKFGYELQNQGRLIPKDQRKIVMITVF